MGFGSTIKNWVSNVWNSVFKPFFKQITEMFIEFVRAALNHATQALVVKFKNVAVDIVYELTQTDLTDEEKRKEAFKRIVAEIKKAGEEYTDSEVNFLIELAYQYVKNYSKPLE